MRLPRAGWSEPRLRPSSRGAARFGAQLCGLLGKVVDRFSVQDAIPGSYSLSSGALAVATLLAPELDVRASARRDGSVDELDGTDEAGVAGEIDGAAARAIGERTPQPR